MPGRSPCVVIGCRRTFKSEGGASEFICGKHFRLADKRVLRAFRKLCRATKGIDYDNAPPERQAWLRRKFAQEDRLWDRIKRQATERAVGI
jgi:hypothetical protein